jgi:hypothetical protein
MQGELQGEKEVGVQWSRGSGRTWTGGIRPGGFAGAIEEGMAGMEGLEKGRRKAARV